MSDVQLVCIACPIGCRLTVRKTAAIADSETASAAAPEVASEAASETASAAAPEVASEAASETATEAAPEVASEAASEESGRPLVVEGNRCPKGEVYGREEVLAPRRTVTAAMRTDSDAFPCVPVRTDKPLARVMVRDLLRELYRGRIALPVKEGDTLIGDWRGTGVGVMATRTLPPDQVPPVREPRAEAEGDDQVPLVQ